MSRRKPQGRGGAHLVKVVADIEERQHEDELFDKYHGATVQFVGKNAFTCGDDDNHLWETAWWEFGVEVPGVFSGARYAISCQTCRTIKYTNSVDQLVFGGKCPALMGPRNTHHITMRAVEIEQTNLVGSTDNLVRLRAKNFSCPCGAEYTYVPDVGPAKETTFPKVAKASEKFSAGKISDEGISSGSVTSSKLTIGEYKLSKEAEEKLMALFENEMAKRKGDMTL